MRPRLSIRLINMSLWTELGCISSQRASHLSQVDQTGNALQSHIYKFSRCALLVPIVTTLLHAYYTGAGTESAIVNAEQL